MFFEKRQKSITNAYACTDLYDDEGMEGCIILLLLHFPIPSFAPLTFAFAWRFWFGSALFVRLLVCSIQFIPVQCSLSFTSAELQQRRFFFSF